MTKVSPNSTATDRQAEASRNPDIEVDTSESGPIRQGEFHLGGEG